MLVQRLYIFAVEKRRFEPAICPDINRGPLTLGGGQPHGPFHCLRKRSLENRPTTDIA